MTSKDIEQETQHLTNLQKAQLKATRPELFIKEDKNEKG